MNLELLAGHILRSELSPLIWIGASIGFRIWIVRLDWWLRSVPQTLPGRAAAGYRNWLLQPLCTELVRLTYYLGIPYAALITGVVPASALGLRIPVLGPELPWLAAVAVGGLLVLAIAWVHTLRATNQLPAPLPGPFLQQLETFASRWGWGVLIREAIYQQAHWGFYRGALNWFLRDVYWGAWLGLFLAGFEAWANPAARQSLRRPGHAPAALLTASLAVISTAAFIVSRNLGITAAVHVLILLALMGLLAAVIRRRPSGTTGENPEVAAPSG